MEEKKQRRKIKKVNKKIKKNNNEINEKEESNVYTYPFKGMVFEGGGPAGIGHLGAIKVFEDLEIMGNIRYFVGSSTGSIIASCLACGAKYDKLYNILFESDFNKFKDDSFGVIRDISRFISKFGWYKGDELEKWIGEIMKDITGDSEITMGQIYEKYGNHLIITVTDVNLGQTIYITDETHSEMKVKKAVKRSSLIPLIFKADTERQETIYMDSDGKMETKIMKHVLIDGGVLNNYPINKLDEILRPEEVVGFKLMTTVEIEQIMIQNLTDVDYPGNVIEYIMLLFNILRNQALKMHVHENDWKRSVKINIGKISATDFEISDENKKYLIDQGRQAAQIFLNDFLNKSKKIEL